MKWFLLFCVLVFASDDVDSDIADLQKHSADALKTLQGLSISGHGEKFDAARAKVMKLASDDKFIKAATDLWSHPNRNICLIAQAVFFLFMLFFKAWRQSKAKNWFTKILGGLILTIFTWTGVAFLIPAIVLGEPFRTVVSTLWKSLFS